MKRLNYFQLFGLRPSFILDQTSLQRRYQSLQKIFHPDVTQNKDQISAQNTSAEINLAYKVLSDKMQRTSYMCELHGFSINQSYQIQDTEKLDKVFEWNERIMDGDQSVYDEIKTYYDTVFNQIVLLHIQMNPTLGDQDPYNMERWQQIKQNTETLCYLDNLLSKYKDQVHEII